MLTNDPDFDEAEELSAQGIAAFSQMLRRGIPEALEPGQIPDARLLLLYLAGFLDTNQMRQMEQTLLAPSVGSNWRRELLRTQKILRQLRSQPWDALLQQAQEGDEMALQWAEIVCNRAVQTENGYALWANLPAAEAWSVIRQQVARGVEQARIAWSNLKGFAEQWRAMRRLDAMKPASVKGESGQLSMYPLIYWGGHTTSVIETELEATAKGATAEHLDYLANSLRLLYWDARIDQQNDLCVEVQWGASYPDTVSFPTHALLSARFVEALWPLGLVESISHSPFPSDEDFQYRQHFTARWTIPGFGEVAMLNRGTLAAEYFRIDLLSPLTGEVPVADLSVVADNLRGDSPEGGLLFGSASPQTPGITDPLVAEAFDLKGNLLRMPPLVLSMAASPIWQPPQLTLSVVVPKYASETYQGLTLLLETYLSDNCWQLLGVWPVHDWQYQLTKDSRLTLTMQAPGIEERPFTAFLRARLILSEIQS